MQYAAKEEPNHTTASCFHHLRPQPNHANRDPPVAPSAGDIFLSLRCRAWLHPFAGSHHQKSTNGPRGWVKLRGGRNTHSWRSLWLSMSRPRPFQWTSHSGSPGEESKQRLSSVRRHPSMGQLPGVEKHWCLFRML